MFELEGQIGQWRTQLQGSPVLKAADLDELEGHLRDTIEALHSQGLDVEEAFWVGRHRIGDAQSLQGEFGKVHRERMDLHRLLWTGFSIAVLIGLLVYSEITIRDFKSLESDRAQLYAHLYGLAINSEVPDEKAKLIFRDIILSPKVNFPIIVTDAQGGIQAWKDCGVADSGSPPSGKIKLKLQALLTEMDQTNQPIPIFLSGDRSYFLHFGTPGLIGNMYLSSYVKGTILLLLLLLLGYIGFSYFGLSWQMAKKTAKSGV